VPEPARGRRCSSTFRTRRPSFHRDISLLEEPTIGGFKGAKISCYLSTRDRRGEKHVSIIETGKRTILCLKPRACMWRKHATRAPSRRHGGDCVDYHIIAGLSLDRRLFEPVSPFFLRLSHLCAAHHPPALGRLMPYTVVGGEPDLRHAEEHLKISTEVLQLGVLLQTTIPSTKTLLHLRAHAKHCSKQPMGVQPHSKASTSPVDFSTIPDKKRLEL